MPTLFNGCGFGPPQPFTAASAWTWIDHPVSGLHPLTFALLRLGFPSAPRLLALNLASTGNSPDRSTKSTRSVAMDSPIPAKQCGWYGGEYKDIHAGVVVYAE